MIGNIGSGSIQNTRNSEQSRVWTNDSVNLNKTTKEEFVRGQLDKSDISVQGKKTEGTPQSADIHKTITADDFAHQENITATDQNSTLMEELSAKAEVQRKPDNSPSALLMEENGTVTDADEVSGSRMPDDAIKTTKHKTATIGTFNIEWLGDALTKTTKGRRPREAKATIRKLQRSSKIQAQPFLHCRKWLQTKLFSKC